MFVSDDGTKKDASIHNPILKKGVDDAVAIRQQALDLGLSEDEINVLYPQTVSK